MEFGPPGMVNPPRELDNFCAKEMAAGVSFVFLCRWDEDDAAADEDDDDDDEWCPL